MKNEIIKISNNIDVLKTELNEKMKKYIFIEFKEVIEMLKSIGFEQRKKTSNISFFKLIDGRYYNFSIYYDDNNIIMMPFHITLSVYKYYDTMDAYVYKLTIHDDLCETKDELKRIDDDAKLFRRDIRNAITAVTCNIAELKDDMRNYFMGKIPKND